MPNNVEGSHIILDRLSKIISGYEDVTTKSFYHGWRGDIENLQLPVFKSSKRSNLSVQIEVS